MLRWGCHVPSALYDTPPSASCRIGAGKPPLDGILIGDSFANHFTGMIDVLAKAQGISVMDYTMDGCPPILGYNTGKAGRYVAYCLRRNEAAYALIASNHYRRVVFAANWPREPVAKEQLIVSIEAVLKSGAELTVILSKELSPVPRAAPSGGWCLAQPGAAKGYSAAPQSILSKSSPAFRKSASLTPIK